MLSFPFLLFAISLVSVTGPSLPVAIIAISAFSWAAVARIVRGQVLSLREREFVEAGRSLGAGDWRIMFVDVLPNVMAPIIVYTTLLIPTVIVVEATLSFLGLGVPPPTPTWGGMLNDAVNYYQVAWWFVVFPGAALVITTLAFNLLGDGVRDAFDPGAERARWRHGPAEDRDDGALPRPPDRSSGPSFSCSSRCCVFALFFVAPNDVARTLAGRQATPETIALIEHATRPRPAGVEAVPRLRAGTPCTATSASTTTTRCRSPRSSPRRCRRPCRWRPARR